MALIPLQVLLYLSIGSVWSSSNVAGLSREAYFSPAPLVTGLVPVTRVRAVDAPHCALLCLAAEVTCVLVGFNHAQRECAMYVYGAVGSKVEKEDGMKWYLNEGSSLPRDCLALLSRGASSPGTYPILLQPATHAVVMCDLQGGGWTVFQRRIDGKVSFSRSWAEYKTGFGDPLHEYWAGTELLHLLTTPPGVASGNRLRIELLAWDGTKSYAEYDGFVVSSEDDYYRMGAGLVYLTHSTAVDALMLSHAGTQFSTLDADHDSSPFYQMGGNCAKVFGGGWWFANCHKANLNGVYNATGFGQGIMWANNQYSYKEAAMMVRRN